MTITEKQFFEEYSILFNLVTRYGRGIFGAILANVWLVDCF